MCGDRRGCDHRRRCVIHRLVNPPNPSHGVSHQSEQMRVASNERARSPKWTSPTARRMNSRFRETDPAGRKSGRSPRISTNTFNARMAIINVAHLRGYRVGEKGRRARTAGVRLPRNRPNPTLSSLCVRNLASHACDAGSAIAIDVEPTQDGRTWLPRRKSTEPMGESSCDGGSRDGRRPDLTGPTRSARSAPNVARWPSKQPGHCLVRYGF